MVAVMHALRWLLLSVCPMLLACPGQPVPTTSPGPGHAADEFVEIARSEARRSFSVPRLIDFTRPASGRDRRVRERAVRALGRVGDDASREALSSLLDDADAAIRATAARALGMTGAEKAESPLVERFRRESDLQVREAILMALGQVGGTRSQPVLAGGFATAGLQEAAAIGLGRLAVRQQPWSKEARRALALAASASDRAVRSAVVFALMREHEPAKDAQILAAVRALAADPDIEVRALAMRALARRDTGFDLMRAALRDGAWRVRVQAVRGLSGQAAGASAWSAVAQGMVKEWQALAKKGFDGPGLHVLIEGLRGLQAKGATPEVAQAVVGLRAQARTAMKTAAEGEAGHAAAMAASTVDCLANAILVRAGSEPATALATCGGPTGRGMPEHERQALLAAVLVRRSGSDASTRVTAWRQLTVAVDPRVRAAALAQAPELLQQPAVVETEELRQEVWNALGHALEHPVAAVAGSAAAAIGTLASKADAPERPERVTQALVRQARDSADNIELALTVMAAVTAVRAAEGRAVCQRAHGHGNRTMRAAARACLQALSGRDPGPGRAQEPPPSPPVSVRPAAGTTWQLELTTSRGVIEIEMADDEAPWHAATVRKLASTGFYDGLLWHRVVADFVVQGGDPSGTGWGGPGFELPAEPSVQPFVRGAVGIADAGLDTGGCQFFIMHSRAHHLDARYTFIGRVSSGLDVVDALQVGDRILSTQVHGEGVLDADTQP